MQNAPLNGRRVIELGTMLAAPFASHILAQLGAEVIKVEPPRGDPTRSLVRGGPSGTFIAYSHGKKSVCIDLSVREGAEAFRKLLGTADILVHNLAPKAARKLGITPERCREVNPALVYCHIRGYGPGPQEDDLASNPVAEAATGIMEGNRINGRPSRLGPSYHDQFAGAYAVISILSALLQRASGEDSAPIEMGLYEIGLHIAARDLVGVQLKTQLLGRPEREPHGEFSMPGYGAYQTADARWIYLLMLTDAHWYKFCTALRLPQADDQDLASLRNRKKQREAVEDIVKRAIGALDFDEAAEKLKAAEVGFTEVLPIERVLEPEQARGPGKLRNVGLRGLSFEVPEFPRLNAANDGVVNLPPPELGEHTLEVLQGAGLSAQDCESLLGKEAIAGSVPGTFGWAPVREKSQTPS